MTENRPPDARPAAPPRPGMKEVADRAGVAISSVSRVLSGHRDVSAVMRNRVLDAVAALGYEPDILAQSMRTGETMTIGFIVSDISNPLISEIALGAETVLRESGYGMIVVNSMNESHIELEHISLMNRRRADGLLLSLASETNPTLPSTLERLHVPVVLVDRHMKGLEANHMVHSDHRAGMNEALDRLYSLGHRSIALINGSLAVRPSRERANALRRFAKAHPDLQTSVRSGEFTGTYGYAVAHELLQEPSPPTALIAGSNQILVGVLRALRDLALRVPDDVSLIACDDSPLAEFMSPALDTIKRDPKRLGGEAASVLLALLRGESPDPVTLPTYFEQRASSASPPTTQKEALLR
ncbi:MAG: LacI family DNA-binding transcriptional regulator [Microcella sp.]|uniref:LacI family DNA-binding transcriptional regulator n=1 Tax=Microcella sp. TaxID=1913979 RepID=UPI0033149804